METLKEQSDLKHITKLLVSVFLVFTVLGFLLINNSSTSSGSKVYNSLPLPNNNISDKFIIGAMQSSKDASFNNLDELGINLWHTYLGSTGYIPNYPSGWTPSDQLNAPIGDYLTGVQGILGNIWEHNGNTGMRALMQRPKIEWLCFGQSSIYEAEDTNNVNSVNPDLWFYAFNYRQGTSYRDYEYNGGGNYVLKCSGNENAGIVLKSLKSNTEQCRPSNPAGNGWMGDGQSIWHIKPRIRIDSNVAHLTSNPAICNIKVFAQDGTTILKDVDIHANDFLVDGGLYYNGRYIEEYNLPVSDTLVVQGDWSTDDLNNWWEYKARGNRFPDTDNNRADIQIYWYKNCDMWIDYVKVENDVADKLFKGFYDDPNNPDFRWLKWEADDLMHDQNSPLKFYIEIPEFNNIPCIAYVADKLRYYTGTRRIDMLTDLTNQYSVHVPWDQKSRLENSQHIIHNYIDTALFTQTLIPLHILFFFRSFYI